MGTTSAGDQAQMQDDTVGRQNVQKYPVSSCAWSLGLAMPKQLWFTSSFEELAKLEQSACMLTATTGDGK